MTVRNDRIAGPITRVTPITDAQQTATGLPEGYTPVVMPGFSKHTKFDDMMRHFHNLHDCNLWHKCLHADLLDGHHGSYYTTEVAGAEVDNPNLVAGTNITITVSDSTVTISAASGTVTTNGTLTSGKIIVGGGGAVVEASNVNLAAGGDDISGVGDLTTTGNTVLGGATSTTRINSREFHDEGVNATTTDGESITLYSTPLATEGVYNVEVWVRAWCQTGGDDAADPDPDDAAGYYFNATFKTVAGTTTQIGTGSSFADEDTKMAGATAELDVFEDDLHVDVTGIAPAGSGTNVINWSASVIVRGPTGDA